MNYRLFKAFALVSLVFSYYVNALDATSSSSTTIIENPTIVWITTTVTLPGTTYTTTPSITYFQSFTSMYTSLAMPSSGSIGLGTISGTVGAVKSLETTIAASSGSSNSHFLGGLITSILSMIAAFLLGTGSLLLL
ncbi:hypothetical protein V1511DRAFT_489751 [Dipodascopsis uninucleata]